MKQNLIYTVFLMISLIFFSGCGEDGNQSEKKIPVAKLFPKIQQHNMVLKVISTRGEYYIAEGAPTMRFQFLNDGLTRIHLPEWKILEKNNIRIQYAECPEVGGSLKIPEDAWKDSPRKEQTGDIPRYPLELDPKSSIIMEMPLSFIGTLKKPGRYAVRGVMDLTSIDVKSTPVELIIR